jgi:hypothetical protein
VFSVLKPTTKGLKYLTQEMVHLQAVGVGLVAFQGLE